jgi:hypothetical protein
MWRLQVRVSLCHARAGVAWEFADKEEARSIGDGEATGFYGLIWTMTQFD